MTVRYDRSYPERLSSRVHPSWRTLPCLTKSSLVHCACCAAGSMVTSASAVVKAKSVIGSRRMPRSTRKRGNSARPFLHCACCCCGSRAVEAAARTWPCRGAATKEVSQKPCCEGNRTALGRLLQPDTSHATAASPQHRQRFEFSVALCVTSDDSSCAVAIKCACCCIWSARSARPACVGRDRGLQCRIICAYIVVSRDNRMG